MAKNKTKTKTKTAKPAAAKAAKPKKAAPSLSPRNRILKFAVSAEEEGRIRDRAAGAGMKLSAFIRSKLA